MFQLASSKFVTAEHYQNWMCCYGCRTSVPVLLASVWYRGGTAVWMCVSLVGRAPQGCWWAGTLLATPPSSPAAQSALLWGCWGFPASTEQISAGLAVNRARCPWKRTAHWMDREEGRAEPFEAVWQMLLHRPWDAGGDLGEQCAASWHRVMLSCS